MLASALNLQLGWGAKARAWDATLDPTIFDELSNGVDTIF